MQLVSDDKVLHLGGDLLINRFPAGIADNDIQALSKLYISYIHSIISMYKSQQSAQFFLVFLIDSNTKIQEGVTELACSYDSNCMEKHWNAPGKQALT